MTNEIAICADLFKRDIRGRFALLTKYVTFQSLVTILFMGVFAHGQNTVPDVNSSIQPQPMTEKGSATNTIPATDPGATVRPALPTAKNPNLPTLYLVGDSTVRNGKGDGAGGQWAGESLW
jgi:hypothetical protein